LTAKRKIFDKRRQGEPGLLIQLIVQQKSFSLDPLPPWAPVEVLFTEANGGNQGVCEEPRNARNTPNFVSNRKSQVVNQKWNGPAAV
jgi:hypothetical protein